MEGETALSPSRNPRLPRAYAARGNGLAGSHAYASPDALSKGSGELV